MVDLMGRHMHTTTDVFFIECKLIFGVTRTFLLVGSSHRANGGRTGQGCRLSDEQQAARLGQLEASQERAFRTMADRGVRPTVRRKRHRAQERARQRLSISAVHAAEGMRPPATQWTWPDRPSAWRRHGAGDDDGRCEEDVLLFGERRI